MSRLERDEELLSLQSIYCDEFNTFETIDPTHLRFRSAPVVLSIILPMFYPDPSCLPEVSIDSEGLGVSRMQMSQLRVRLEDILKSKPNQLVLFELTEETREFMEGLRNDIKVAFEEEEEDYCDDIWEPDDASQRETDLAIAQSHMGSVTLDSIVERLPNGVRLLHAENVLRKDLRAKYLTRRRKLQQDVTSGVHDRRTKDAAWDKYGQQEIVFHGTLRRHVGSIVRSGFVVPGQNTVDGEKVEVRCGSTWGQGIYTSPEPGYSLSYADHTDGEYKSGRRLLPGQKLVVCAIVMGRRAEFGSYGSNRRLNANVKGGYHSHVSPNKMEYVVFHSAQVLPLFVLHLGDGSKKGIDPQNNTLASLLGAIPNIVATRDNTQAKRSLTEYARKHLPNGFGAASGHRFVVEAIAPVDDDEELWGDYQHDGTTAFNGEFQEERWRW